MKWFLLTPTEEVLVHVGENSEIRHFVQERWFNYLPPLCEGIEQGRGCFHGKSDQRSRSGNEWDLALNSRKRGREESFIVSQTLPLEVAVETCWRFAVKHAGVLLWSDSLSLFFALILPRGSLAPHLSAHTHRSYFHWLAVWQGSWPQHSTSLPLRQGGDASRWVWNRAVIRMTACVQWGWVQLQLYLLIHSGGLVILPFPSTDELHLTHVFLIDSGPH